MATCENCKHHSAAGFRMPPVNVPKCSKLSPMRTLEHVNKPTSEGGHDNIWTGVTPDWCPKNN